MIVRIPRGWYDEHTICLCLPAPPVVRKTERHYWIDNAHVDYAELVANARFYVDPYGPEEGRWTKAARAFLRAIG